MLKPLFVYLFQIVPIQPITILVITHESCKKESVKFVYLQRKNIIAAIYLKSKEKTTSSVLRRTHLYTKIIFIQPLFEKCQIVKFLTLSSAHQNEFL